MRRDIFVYTGTLQPVLRGHLWDKDIGLSIQVGNLLKEVQFI